MNAKWLKLGLLALLMTMPNAVQASVNIIIVNNDGPGEGFNDPTPAVPVGGNTGTTIGQQRLIAVQHAANIWGSQLNSSVDIFVRANFDPLFCNATTAALGQGAPDSYWRDFPGAPLAGHWYPNALANKLSGTDLSIDFEIIAVFNSSLGQPGCLGQFFYYGLDNNHGASIDLVTEALHELAHGLGFVTSTSSSDGSFRNGFPSVYDHFVLDLDSGLLWDQMTDAERVASAINPRKVVWNGGVTTALAPLVLQSGTPELTIGTPANVAGTYLVGTALFGPPLSSAGVTGDLMPVVDTSPAGPGCNPFNAQNAVAVNNNIALIDRGVCGFAVKVKLAQIAGAKAVVIADNMAGSPPAAMTGVDPTIAIPAVRISLEDANKLKDQLRFRSRTRSGVVATLSLNP